MTHKQYKCQTQGTESYIDNQFIIFSQSYLLESIRSHVSKKSYTNNVKGRPNVMELGCYNGRLMHFMTQVWMFCNYTGVDVRKDYLETSMVANRKDTTLLCEDVTQGLSVPDNSQDVIVSSEVLEHLNSSDLPAVMQTLCNKVRKGGKITLAFPMNTKEKEFHNLDKEKNLGHVNFPEHDAFIQLADSVGLDLESFDSGFSLKSSYRVPKSIKDSQEYKTIRRTLGSPVARCYAMTIDSNHTGGGYYNFIKR
jgi:2-polyprenyl-3-methyl-5-hydroxy-6-metoxy-1,4-benzoquinol methylase